MSCQQLQPCCHVVSKNIFFETDCARAYADWIQHIELEMDAPPDTFLRGYCCDGLQLILWA